jgi:DHA3 family macrolide efflux protein-like MFS transporter
VNKSKNLLMYMCGRFISLIGSGIQMIALPLYILDLTGSGTLMGVFSMLTLVPALVTAPFSGIIGDRKNRRNIMVIMDIGRGAIILLLGTLAMLGSLNLYILFIFQVIISMMDSLFNSSSSALMPDLVSKEELIQANSAKGGFDAASMILGPALGGVIYGIWGIKMVFYINGVSFIVSAIFSAFIKYNKKVIIKEKMTTKVFFSETSDALRFIISKKGLLQLFTFAMISNFLLAPMFDIIMPYVLKKKIGFTSQQFGYVICFFTVGVLLGNIGLAVYFKKLTPKKLIKTGLIIESIVTILMCVLVFPGIVGFYGGATLALFSSITICCLAMGFFNAFVNTPISTNLQKLVPSDMRSRFFSILGMFSQGAIPLGCLLYGILLDLMPYYNLLTIINIISVLVSAIFLIKACDEAYEAKNTEDILEIMTSEISI